MSQHGESVNLWHQRLEHLVEQHLNEMVAKEMVIEMKLPNTAKLIFMWGSLKGE